MSAITKDTIIFDFDGVLVESEIKGFELIQRLLKKDHGLDLAQRFLPQKIGKPTLTFLAETFGDKLTQDQIQRFYKNLKIETCKNFINYVTPHIEVLDFIRENKGILAFAVASMNTQDHIRHLLKQFKVLDYFDQIVTRDSVVKHKPDPEIYLKTLKMLKKRTEATLVVEDSPLGVESANNANLDCIVLLNGFNKRSDFDHLNVAGFIEKSKFGSEIKKYLVQ